jgi:hypothetical protein
MALWMALRPLASGRIHLARVRASGKGSFQGRESATGHGKAAMGLERGQAEARREVDGRKT